MTIAWRCPWIALLFLAGCGNAIENPPDASDDLAAAPADLAGCAPPCSGQTLFCNATRHCVACLHSADCAAGSYCKIVNDAIASCTPGCDDDSRCGGGEKCCNAACVDPATDEDHCGACDTSCGRAHAKTSCAASMCKLGACDPGWGDCDADPASGCEANLRADPKNCVTCGTACALAHAVNACSDGCYVSACDFGFDDCNNTMMDGCETNVAGDIVNCGACGKKCPPVANASPACAAGTCGRGPCTSGFADCDGDPKNGCEVSVATDGKNCGQCGNLCPQNTPRCDKGLCVDLPGPIIHYDAADPNSYPGNGNMVFDLSGNGVTGTFVNNLTFATLGGVKTLVFDGAGAGVRFPNATLDNRTFGAIYWIYSQVPPQNTNQGGLYVNWTQNAFNPPNWIWFGKWDNDNWYFRVNNGNCCQDIPGSGMGGWTANVPQNQWLMVHFFFQVGTPNGWKWGVNGKSVAVSTLPSRQLSQAEALSTIGWGHAGNGSYWKGGISSTRFYNALLSDGELTMIFDATKAGYGY